MIIYIWLQEQFIFIIFKKKKPKPSSQWSRRRPRSHASQIQPQVAKTCPAPDQIWLRDDQIWLCLKKKKIFVRPDLATTGQVQLPQDESCHPLATAKYRQQHGWI